MPEHLRALIVILGAALLVFQLAEKRVVGAAVMTAADFRRRRNLWFAVTSIAFLGHNFWVHMLLTAGVLAYFSSRERNPLALYVLLLFAVPPLDADIPGLGLINYIFTLNYIRLLNLVILLPLALRLAEQGKSNPKPAWRWIDGVVLAYIGYLFVMQSMEINVTSMMRNSFYLLVDIWLPYYAFSRALRSLQAFQEVAMAFVLAIAVMAPLAAFEVVRSWLLYDGLRDALGLPPAVFHTYIWRGDGPLRANVAAGNSIVLGYLMMSGIGLFLAVAASIRPRSMAVLAGLTLFAGLIAALARGPWVGSLLVVVVGLCIGHGAGRRIAWLVLGGGLSCAAILASPLGDTVVAYLPFVGTVEEGSHLYRQRLFDVSMLVLWQNPWFGAFDYVDNPVMEEMRQGQGIIDIVNTYLAVALAYGLIGLALFVGPFAAGLWACFSAHRRIGATDPQAEALGRALIGTVVGILVTIATVSSIGVVPTIYWLMLGLCVGYARLFNGDPLVQPARAVAGPPAGRPGLARQGRRGVVT